MAVAVVAVADQVVAVVAIAMRNHILIEDDEDELKSLIEDSEVC